MQNAPTCLEKINEIFSMKECFYSVLGVDRKVDDDGIKKAYRQLALKHHPDKQAEADRDNATVRFQLISEAYEVLSDKQERAWYDSHKDQIIRGNEHGVAGTEEYASKQDIWKYFTASCFNGRFDDSEQGFYQVYGQLFEELGVLEKDDISADSDDESSSYLPGFGTSKSEFEDVQSFYSNWGSFASCRYFAGFDKWNPREGENRQVRRAMDVENKKARSAARREYSSAVRSLVAYVKRRDRRMIEYLLKMSAREKELKEAKAREAKEKEEMKRLARQAGREEEMRRWEEVERLRVESGEFVVVEEDVEDEKEFVCIACRKTFKSEKSFANHENSKKHKLEILKLRRELMLSEDELEEVVVKSEVKKPIFRPQAPQVLVEEVAEVIKLEVTAPPEVSKRKPRRREKGKKVFLPEMEFACKICLTSFSSKTTLFKHLAEAGHHAPK